MKTRCVRLDHDLDVVGVGRSSGLLWSRDGLLIAGVGVGTRIPVERPGGADEAQARLAEIVASDEVDAPASGVVAMAALPFDRHAVGELIVPRVTLVREPGGRRWMIHDDDLSNRDSIEMAVGALEAEPVGAEPGSYQVRSAVAPERWRDDVVAATRDRIAAGEFRKVVVARELVVETDEPIDTAAVLRRLHQAYGTSIVFAVDGFVGATPELLVGRNDDVVHAHPLAGTAPRSSDPAADGRLAAGLAASDKNRAEHRITIDWLLDNLLPFCSYVDAEPEPSIVSLANVHHLGTRVEGRLSGPAASVLELVAALHPTPAVGGAPQAEALACIAEVEPGDRGRYAGPVGWVDGAGNGEFAVGIRSGSIEGNRARVWAGVGVVADSDPAAELSETRSKFQAMLGALVRP